MSQRNIEELWTLFLEGRLSVEEEKALSKALSANTHLREELLDDAEISGMLSGIGRTKGNESFMAEFAQRLMNEGPGAAVIPLEEDTEQPRISTDPPPPRRPETPPPSVIAPPAVTPPPTLTAPPTVVGPSAVAGASSISPPPVVHTPSAAAKVTPGAGSATPAAGISASSMLPDYRQRPRIWRMQPWTIVGSAAAIVTLALVGIIVWNASSKKKSHLVSKPEAGTKSKVPSNDQPEPSSDPRQENPLPAPTRNQDTDVDDGEPRPGPSRQVQPPQIVDKSPSKQAPPETPKMPPDYGKPLGQIVRATNAVWEKQPTDALGDTPLVLHEGTVEILMQRGARVTIHGPAALQLAAADRMLLAYGRVSASVPQPAIGFMIETPLSKVVDLGTRFDVLVENDGATDVTVAEGKVELTSRGNPRAKPRTWQLTAGQFKRVGSDGSVDDWNLAVRIDAAGRGSVQVNGKQFGVASLNDFKNAEQHLTAALATAGDRIAAAGNNAFQGAVVVNGQRAEFKDRAGFSAVRRRAARQVNGVRDLMNRADNVRGSININGMQFDYRSLQELMKVRDELQRRFGGNAGVNIAGMNFGGLGNMDEILRSQQQALRGLGIRNGAAGGLDQAREAMDMANDLLRGFGNFFRDGVRMPPANQRFAPPRERELRRNRKEQRRAEAQQRLDAIRGRPDRGAPEPGFRRDPLPANKSPKQPARPARKKIEIPDAPQQAARGLLPRPEVEGRPQQPEPSGVAGKSAPRERAGIAVADLPDVADVSAAILTQRALDAELLGDESLREGLLQLALKKDPEFAPAHWQSGRVYQPGPKGKSGNWVSIAEVEDKAGQDTVFNEYAKLRDNATDDAPGNEKLAYWCSKNGLGDHSRLHWARVLHFQPAHLKAQRRLGLSLYRGRLLTRDQIDDQRKQSKELTSLKKEWLPKIRRWKRDILGKQTAARDAALQELSQVKDPRLIGLLESYLSPFDQKLAGQVVRVLGGMSQQPATESLIRHAVFSPFAAVRREAAMKLKPRPMYGHVPLLIGGMAAPYEFTSWAEEGSRGIDTFRYAVKREGKYVDHLVQGAVGIGEYRPQPVRIHERQPLRAEAIRQRKRKADDLKRDLRRKVRQLNRDGERFNRPIQQALTVSTGVDLGNDPRKWNEWWNEYTEYSSPETKPVKTSFEYDRAIVTVRPHSCFPAGTLVRTRRGLRPIESLRVGDFVLAKHPQTGELAYKPVVQTTAREVDQLVELACDGETMRTTRGHPFWVSGSGWEMAKTLRPGDKLHHIRGSIEVESVREIPGKQRVFNLVVAEFKTYFVGKMGVLVHDNSLFKSPGVSIPGEKLVR